MPIHDWTRVDAGIFHAFHHDWITAIARALNHGILPGDYYALPEQFAAGMGPDVLTLRRPAQPDAPAVEDPGGGLAVETAPPSVSIHMRAEATSFSFRAKQVVIRHISRHQVIAMAEILSPGNKSSLNGLNAFVAKARQALAAGIHLLLIDLFPPGPRDPRGIHPAVWGDDCPDDFELPPNKPFSCVSYIGAPGAEAFIEPVGQADELPAMPLFLSPEKYVPVPLAATYATAWEGLPNYWRGVLEANA